MISLNFKIIFFLLSIFKTYFSEKNNCLEEKCMIFFLFPNTIYLILPVVVTNE